MLLMKYICPFCYKTMPEGYEPSGWSCCGEVGHATILPECPKCGAESLELPLAHCAVCGWKSEEYLRRRDCLNGTPRTDALVREFPASAGLSELAECSCRLTDLARQLERELHAMTICAGVASKERGEWATEREDIIEKCARMVDEYSYQSETGDLLDMLAKNMRGLSQHGR